MLSSALAVRRKRCWCPRGYAPHSQNTGAMRRRVDLRWRIRLEEIERLRDLQHELLRKAAPLLKPGGTLIYSTCSLEPEENELIVDEFLREHPGFTLASSRELLPFIDGVDGAYVARLVRGPAPLTCP